jgi:hypothetical protein
VSEEPTAEDRALLAALAALEPGSGTTPTPPPFPAPTLPEGAAAAMAAAAAPLAGEAAEAETLSRLYHETLGLLPYGLPPLPPSPEAKRRLMAQVATRPASPTSTSIPSSLSGFSGPSGPAIPARPFRWPLALAAALILALLATCGWLIRDLREREAVVARLAGQRNTALRQVGEVEARLARLRFLVNNMLDSLAVVSSPGVEVCNLRAATPEMGNARGILFVAADHQHWTIALRGLRPPGGGKVYHLWFVADQGMVSFRTFSTELGALTELGSAHMPAGTKGVRITLESSPGAPAPSGPDVLRNADTLHAIS